MTYWTGIWEPHREALSKEVESLRRTLRPRSLVVSFSAGQRTSIHPGARVIRLSADRYAILRLMASVLERTSDLSHAFGSLDCWHFLQALGRRPTILTVAYGGTAMPDLYDHITLFAVQAQPLRRLLLKAGVSEDRIRLIYPGIDLQRFQEAPPPANHTFTVLVASTPADTGEFEPRGIPLVVAVARLCPDIEFVLLWRQWGNLDLVARALARLKLPDNVTVRHQDAPDMAPVYHAIHAVICCFAPGFGKTCPNSVMEALACGRPVVVTAGVGLADVIADEGIGVVASRDAESAAAALESLRASYKHFQSRARSAAEKYFDLRRASRDYAGLYSEVTGIEV